MKTNLSFFFDGELHAEKQNKSTNFFLNLIYCDWFAKKEYVRFGRRRKKEQNGSKEQRSCIRYIFLFHIFFAFYFNKKNKK